MTPGQAPRYLKKRSPQTKLLSMQLIVFFALILNILLYNFSVAILTNRIRIVSTCPETATPQCFLHFWKSLKNLSGCDAFYDSYHLFYRHCRYPLNQKMNVVFICANLNKLNFKTITNLQADLFNRLTDRPTYHLPSIFHRKNQMIQKKCFVMPFVDMFIHSANLRFSSVSKTLGFQTILFYPGASPEEFS